MRLRADANIVAIAVETLRAQGHDVVHVAERSEDPGDQAIIQEAFASQGALLTKDHDVGAQVFRDKIAHAGVVLIDDLGSPQEETLIASKATDLAGAAFIRAGRWGSRIATETDRP